MFQYHIDPYKRLSIQKMLSPWDTHQISLQVRHPRASSMTPMLMLIVDVSRIHLYVGSTLVALPHPRGRCYEPKILWKGGGCCPMLGWYIGECMVSLININNDIKELACGYQNFHTAQILIFNEYVKVRETFCTQVINCVHIIMSHSDTWVIMLSSKGPCMVCTPKWYHKMVKKIRIRIKILTPLLLSQNNVKYSL